MKNISKVMCMTLLLVLASMTFVACGKSDTPQTFTIEVGAYGYDAAVATNIATGEVIELGAEVLHTNLNNPWWWLISFNIRINADDQFNWDTDKQLHQITKSDRTYYLVANNTLRTYEEKNGWSVVITMGKHKVYG